MAIFTIQTKLKDDVIPLLVKYPFLYLETRLKLMITFICSAIFFSHITMIGFVQLFANTNADYWINHFLATFGSWIMITSYAVLMGKRWDYYDLIDTFFPQFWPLHSTDNPSRCHAVVKNQGLLAELHCLTIIIISTVVIISFIPLDEYNCNHFAVFQLIRDRLGRKWAYPAAIPMYLSMFHAGYAIEACAASMTYLALHLKFQLFFLNDQLEQMQEVDWVREQHLPADADYQFRIRRKLVICIRHYCLLERFANRINAMIFYPIFAYVIGGIVLTLGIVANLKYSGGDAEFSVKPLILGCAGVAVSGSFSVIGQLIEDESEKVFTSTANLPWYLWNSENKKMVLLLLVATKKRITFSSAGLITMNNRLVITLYRLAYSAVMLLIKL